jgi:hypothetical protein
VVFSMASNRRNKPAKLPTRALTRPSKKRSHSISTPSVPAAKKTRPRAAPQPPTRVSTPPRPKVSPFTPSPPASAQPLIDIDKEDNDEGEEEVEDDNVEEPPPPPVVRFMSVWKAFNRMEVLPGTRSAMLDQNILYLTAIKA